MLDSLSGNNQAWKEFISKDTDFTLARKEHTTEFYDFYQQGFEYFRKGEWEKSKEKLVEANV
jgi:hypothetical protein